MKKLIQIVSAAAIALSVAAPATIVMSGDALALTKKQARKCHYYAEEKSRKKTNKRVLGSMIVGGIGGAIAGDVLGGGKKTSIIAGAGGAAVGMAHGASKRDKYYRKYFAKCASHYDADYGDDEFDDYDY